MTPVTLVMPYYLNPGMLREQYRRIRQMSAKLRDNFHVVIVDDGSPSDPAWVEDIGCPLQVWRIRKDVRWNQDAARNIGVRHAETTWIMMTDIDHIVPEVTWSILIGKKWDPDCAYSFQRMTLESIDPDKVTEYKPHPNTWFLAKGLFDVAGRYDERFAGYYGTDGDFKVRLLRKAKNWIKLKERVWRVPRSVIPDASTTTYLRKQPDDMPTIKKMTERREKSGDPVQNFTFEYDRVS